MGSSAIEWTDETWNPTTGCDRISPGCVNCYALTLAARLKAMGQKKYQRDGDPATSGPGFGLSLHEDVVDRPLRWQRPRRVFVDSMSDLFHQDVPTDFLAEVFAVMALADRHTFQVLTKRPQRMAQVFRGAGFLDEVDSARLRRNQFRIMPDWPRPNIWLGTSIENDRYTFRADHLRSTPAAVRFLSLEPLLGPLPSLDLTGIDWVIVGGESGSEARPMHPDWARDVRDRCVEAGVPFFFKQWGAWVPESQLTEPPSKTAFFTRRFVDLAGAHRYSAVSAAVFRVGKKAAGRLLDGRTWDEMPAVAS